MVKIAVYTMAKNEAEHVPRFAETVREADRVVVTDTGSTDGTPDLLRDAGIEVHTGWIVPWRFDVASNVALAHVPDDVDVCVKLDLDEVLWTADSSPWREEIERLWQPGVNRLRYWYTWSWHVRGEVPAVRFRNENIHSRSGFVWRHPGHAALCCQQFGAKTADSERLEIHHYMTPKRRPDYLKLLELGVREHRCPRTLFYLGREYFYRQMNPQAIQTLGEYLAHPEAKWSAERADALRMAGICWRRAGDAPRGLANLLQAIAECGDVRDLWFELLQHFHDTGDWEGGCWSGGRCLAISERHPHFVGHGGWAWSEHPLVLSARCAWHAGRKEQAVTLLRTAIASHPNSELAQTLAREILAQAPRQETGR